MKNEPDHKLADWLDEYKVVDAGQDLLDRIAAAAARTPQERTREQKRGWSGNWGQSWASRAAAFAAVALLGFWMGSGSLPKTAGTAAASTRVAQESATADTTYLDKMIFGPTSWREVKL